jgi:hypothetical protein
MSASVGLALKRAKKARVQRRAREQRGGPQIGGALFEVTQPRVTCYRVGILGIFILTDHFVEFFPPFERGQEYERFAVGCYRSGQFVKRRRVFGDLASLYVRIRRKFKDSLYDFGGETRVGFHTEPPSNQLDVDKIWTFVLGLSELCQKILHRRAQATRSQAVLGAMVPFSEYPP